MKRASRKVQAILLSTTLVLAMLPASAYASGPSDFENYSSRGTFNISNVTSSSEGSEPMEKPNEADAKITKGKAEELARSYVHIPKEFVLRNASLSSDYQGDSKRTVWALQFEQEVNGKSVASIYASIHAGTGQLVNYGFNNYRATTTSYPLKVERAEAQQIAEVFIGEVAANYTSQVKLDESFGAQVLPVLTGEVYHHFQYVRQVNDIPFLSNYINVSVNSEGHIVSYDFIWSEDIQFPKISNQISLEQATKLIKEAGQPELKYIVPYRSSGTVKPYLSYELSAFAVDAVTGKKAEDPNSRIYRYGGDTEEKPLTDKPLSAKPKTGEMKQEQAIEIITSSFALPEGAELANSSYNEHRNRETGEMQTSWDLSWNIKKDGKEIGSIWAAVDGSSGQILSYSNYAYSEEGNEKSELITLEQATSKAIEVVKKQLPWLTHELHLIKPDPKQYENIDTSGSPRYYLGFAHKVHGATVEYDYLGVAIDARTGQVQSFESYFQPYTYPATAPKVITKAEAMEQWLNYYDIVLTYRSVTEYLIDGEPIPIEKYRVMMAAGDLNSNSKLDTSTKVDVVYQLREKPLEERIFLDAETGGWRSQATGDAAYIERPIVVDAEGHWAQQQLELMVAYKALDLVDGKVRPNEPIKRGELIKMLVIAKSSGAYSVRNTANESASFKDVGASSAYFAYVEDALSQNLIDIGDGSFNPEGNVTREEMAELIVRALGYNTLAKVDNIFVEPFTDTKDITNKGQATIVVGLNIMSANKDGKFQPKKQVQRAEAAAAFFRYLQSRAQLEEAPLRM